MQAKLNHQGRRYINGLARTMRQLWKQMCEDVGINPHATFVDEALLSQSRYYSHYNTVAQQLSEAVNQYNAGGYVGLSLPRKESN